MLDSISIKAPAKVNLFLKVLNKRLDGYHNIISAITFVNLYDVINIKLSSHNSITYNGKFKPFDGYYKDCIIQKTLDILSLDQNFKFEISIKKNIPVRGGLGSASTNAAGLINGLKKLNILKYDNTNLTEIYKLSTDLNSFIYGRDCFVKSSGDNVSFLKLPKYFFLLIKPTIDFSTKDMYSNLKRKSYINIDFQNQDTNHKYTSGFVGNDFEKIAVKKSSEIKKILDFLNLCEGSISSNLTGSGSCCFALFNKKEYANRAKEEFLSNFPNLWTAIVENNTIID